MCTRVYITAIYPSEIVAPMKQGATTETTPARLIARPGTGFSSDDEHLFRDLLERFAVLAETCFRFSRGIYLRVSGSPEPNTEDAVRRNLSIARRVFGEGLLEILAVVYLKKSISLAELQGTLGETPAEPLRRKLRILQASGLIQTAAPYERADQAHYTLTHKGTIIARLGEPVFLYLRLAEGWIRSAVEEAATAETETSHKIDPPRPE